MQIDILNNDFSCKICGKDFNRKCDLSRHLTSFHDISVINYCLKYFLDYNYPKCKCGCDKKVNFVNFNYNEYLIGHTGGHGGKHLVGKTYEQIYGKQKSIEIKKRISDSSKGRKLSKEHVLMIINCNTGKVCTKETKRKMRISAIEELGYWVDGYDKENNIVYEYDEKRHKYKKDKDKQRQREIEEFLECEFIRIKE